MARLFVKDGVPERKEKDPGSDSLVQMIMKIHQYADSREDRMRIKKKK